MFSAETISVQTNVWDVSPLNLSYRRRGDIYWLLCIKLVLFPFGTVSKLLFAGNLLLI